MPKKIFLLAPCCLMLCIYPFLRSTYLHPSPEVPTYILHSEVPTYILPRSTYLHTTPEIPTYTLPRTAYLHPSPELPTYILPQNYLHTPCRPRFSRQKNFQKVVYSAVQYTTKLYKLKVCRDTSPHPCHRPSVISVSKFESVSVKLEPSFPVSVLDFISVSVN